VGALDGQAGFGVGAAAVHLPVVNLAGAMKGDPEVERAGARGGPQHAAPVLADRQ
jgi:hypothetical protein